MSRFWKALLLFVALSLAAVGGYAARTEYFVHTTTTTAVIGTADINGGAIDGTVIGGTTPAAATFTTGTVATADINGGAIDDTAIGGTTPAAGTFTTATVATADINGGAIDATNIGSGTPGAAAFTTLKASTNPTDEHGVGDRGFGDSRYVEVVDTTVFSRSLLDDSFPATARATLVLLLDGYIRGMEVSYKDSDEVYVSGGAMHIYDGANYMVETTAQITKAITGHGETDVPIYFYIDRPAAASYITGADIEWHTTAPTYSHANCGWYHPTTTDWRFIGSVTVDGSGDIIEGTRHEDGHLWIYDIGITLKTGFQTATWTDIENIEDFTPHIDNAMALLYFYLYGDSQAVRTIAARKDGSSGHYDVCRTYDLDDADSNQVRIPVDSTGRAEWELNNASAVGACYSHGYWEPR